MREVLHDWDNPYPSGSWALKRGISLICYAVTKFLKHPMGSVANETDSYVITLLKLDELLGIRPIFGLRDEVSAVKGSTASMLKLGGYDVRRHVHVGERLDPKRTRTWEPPLNQSPATWHFEDDCIAHRPTQLFEGELPCWHIDYPHHLRAYIDYLHSEYAGK